ncbi:MAG: MbnP family protein [Bacteroidota bacterium]
MSSKYNSFARYFLFLSAFALIFSATGCGKEEGCTDPNSLNFSPTAEVDDGTCEYPQVGNLKLHFHAKAGSSNLTLGSELTDADGRKIQFNVARFYISNIRLHQDGGGMLPLTDTYVQVNASTMEYAIDFAIPSGHYHGIMFDVGVDDAANTGDPSLWPTGHPLSSTNPTFDHWSWATGYKFLRLEGLVDTTAAMNATANAEFIYHVGLGYNRRTVDIEQHFNVEFNSTPTVHLDVDWLDFLENVDLTTQLNTVTMNDSALAATIINRVPTAIVAE